MTNQERLDAILRRVSDQHGKLNAKQQAYAIREIGRVRGRGTLARMGAEIIGATRKDYRLDLFAKMMGFIKSEHAIEINTGGARTAEEIEADVAALDKELEELTRKDDA